MSVDIDWETLTGGPDGAALAEVIKDFIHDRFQAIKLPKLIRSVTVHRFEFGSIAPKIQIKDICDPLPDFYESDEEDSDTSANKDVAEHKPTLPPIPHPTLDRPLRASLRQSERDLRDKVSSPGLTRGSTPAMLGTTSHLGYFHIPLSGGLHGTQTPLAAVAGAHFGGNHHVPAQNQHHHSESLSSITPPSSVTPVSSHGGHTYFDNGPGSAAADDEPDAVSLSAQLNQHLREVSPEDLQVVFHVTYAGDVKLSLTADVFLDYPMPSFVGIPLKLKITGLTFDGVGILAYIKKRAHVCFLSPEDAEALVGDEAAVLLDPLDDGAEEARGKATNTNITADDDDAPKTGRVGALLEGIKIESEMGETDSGKQVLKNVDKIEKFILEQVRRIFEDEFVYPSFWTFLV